MNRQRFTVSTLKSHRFSVFTALLIICLAIVPMAQAQQEIPDPELWYRNDYAVIWANAPWEQHDALISHSADQVMAHSLDDGITMLGKDWLTLSLQGWRDEGWLNSELADLKVDRLNETLATFKAMWRDNMVDNGVEYGCAWYQADYLEGAWKLSGYADIDCQAHGLAP